MMVIMTKLVASHVTISVILLLQAVKPILYSQQEKFWYFIDISKINHYFLSKMPIHVYSIFFFISTLQKSRVKVRDNLFFSVFYDKSILNTFFLPHAEFFYFKKN